MESQSASRKNMRNLLKNTSSGILVSITLDFMLIIYAPLELYFTNYESFWFDLAFILPAIFLTFIIVVIISTLLCICLCISYKRVYNLIVLCCFSILICSYIQGNFLTFNLPPLDGTSIEWGTYTLGRIASLTIWVIAIITIVLVARNLPSNRFFKAINIISICMFLLLLFTLTFVGINTNGWKRKDNLISTTKNQFEMSLDNNFIILLFDAVDADTFSMLFEQSPVYKYVFEDFTYYNNTVCAYPFTKHSIPFILTGVWYENDQSFEEYTENAYKNSSLFAALRANDYKIGLYDADISIKTDNSNLYDNMVSTQMKVTSKTEFIHALIKMGGIKFAPFELKKYCYDAPTELNELKDIIFEGELKAFNWGNLPFYLAASDKDSISFTENKCFKFIHLEGAHVPYRYDKDLNLIENGTYPDNVEACITLSWTYLQKLKEAEVYDNSIIIIMSDHGYDEVNGINGRQNPILLIKGINEKHDMQVSSAPISYEDLQEAYIKLLSGKYGDGIFKYQAGDYRERRYLLYEYEKDNHMIEYIQTGQAKDLDTLIPTGREYNLN